MKPLMAFCLFLIALSAVIFFHSFTPVFTIALAVTVTFISDSIFIRIRKIPPFPLEASLVSGFIIGLLTAPSLPFYFPVMTATLAMFGKNSIRFQNRHIFNPAGFGLFLTSIIFSKQVSWWGVSWQSLELNFLPILFFLILLSPGIVSFIKMQRYRIILSFWAIYILLLFLSKITVYLDPTAIFFSLVMLPEPMTTPNYPNRQLIFGPTVAVLSFLTGSLILGLLISNFIFYSLNILIVRLNMKA